MIEFIETDANTYMRVQTAKDYFEKLYKCKGQVYVRGIFKDQDGMYADALDWVQVHPESTAFYHIITDMRYTFVGKFDFRIVGVK